LSLGSLNYLQQVRPKDPIDRRNNTRQEEALEIGQYAKWEAGFTKATLKTPVALAAVNGDKTVAEFAGQFHVHPTQITGWKPQLLARAADRFAGTKPPSETPTLKTLHAKIGQLTLENDFLESGLIKTGLLSTTR
jgi:transposase